MCVFVSVNVSVSVSVSVSVCMCESERERESACACVRVCVCVPGRSQASPLVLSKVDFNGPLKLLIKWSCVVSFGSAYNKY